MPLHKQAFLILAFTAAMTAMEPRLYCPAPPPISPSLSAVLYTVGSKKLYLHSENNTNATPIAFNKKGIHETTHDVVDLENISPFIYNPGKNRCESSCIISTAPALKNNQNPHCLRLLVSLATDNNCHSIQFSLFTATPYSLTLRDHCECRFYSQLTCINIPIHLRINHNGFEYAFLGQPK